MIFMLNLTIGLLLIADIGTYIIVHKQINRLEAVVAAINEDLVAMDADLQEVFDFCFPEEEAEPAAIVGKPIYVEHGEEMFDSEPFIAGDSFVMTSESEFTYEPPVKENHAPDES